MDLFDKIEALWTKEEVEDPPDFWQVHRVLAGRPDYALIVRKFNRTELDAERLWTIWWGIIPKGKKPYIPYAGSTKMDSPTELVEKIMEQTTMNQQEAEEVVEFAELQGRHNELAKKLGVE